MNTTTFSNFSNAAILVGSLGALFLGFGFTPAAEAQVPLVLALGDSITHGLGDTGVSCFGSSGGYPPRLRSSLQSRGRQVSTRTFGICGELSSGGVSRINNVLGQNPEADVILIMEGTNDLSNNNISIESIRFNINTMVDRAEAAGVVPVMASPIPRAPEGGNNANTAYFRGLLRTDAENRNVVFADAYGGMIDIFDLYNRFYSDPYHPNSSGYDILAQVFLSPTEAALDRLVPEVCTVGENTLCLSSERFRVEVEWQTGSGSGQATAVPSSSDTGFFWFFNSDNLELVVKVLDGRDINGHFWVFYGALSDVQYEITVTDTQTRRQKVFTNPQGQQASVGDTLAFRD